jgi:hypothetical protein
VTTESNPDSVSRGDLAALPELHVADGTLALETPVGRIAIPFAGRITSGPTGALDGGFTLLAENLEDPGLAARRIDGALDFAWPPGGLPRLSAHLRIADFAAAGAALRTASLDIALDGEDGTAELRLEESGDTAALYARASLQALPGAPEGTAEIDAHATAGSALWRILDMPPPTQDRVELASTLAGKLSPARPTISPERPSSQLMRPSFCWGRCGPVTWHSRRTRHSPSPRTG